MTVAIANAHHLHCLARAAFHGFPIEGVSINGGSPKWMVYFRENPIKIDDLGVPPFQETSNMGL